MPGSVSDSYDPEFGTSSNAAVVQESIESVRRIVTTLIGDDSLKHIVGVCYSEDDKVFDCPFTERELRIIRFCLNQQLEAM